jgi:hypothetical protein
VKEHERIEKQGLVGYGKVGRTGFRAESIAQAGQSVSGDCLEELQTKNLVRWPEPKQDEKRDNMC